LRAALPTPPDMRDRIRRFDEGCLRLVLLFRCQSFGILSLESFQSRTGDFHPTTITLRPGVQSIARERLTASFTDRHLQAGRHVNSSVHRQSANVTRFWIIHVIVALVVSAFAFTGVTSIMNARLLAKSAIPSRYKHLVTESVAAVHVHDVHVKRRFMFVELNGFSDDHSYVQVGELRFPISNHEWFGWMLVAMGLVTITVWLPRLIRYRSALAKDA